MHSQEGPGGKVNGNYWEPTPNFIHVCCHINGKSPERVTESNPECPMERVPQVGLLGHLGEKACLILKKRNEGWLEEPPSCQIQSRPVRFQISLKDSYWCKGQRN